MKDRYPQGWPENELRGAKELAEFINTHYRGRVVEVGSGYRSDISHRLRGMEVVATDLAPRSLTGIEVVADDIFHPDMKLYRGASLIFSIRPPLEMQLAMGRLALRLGCDILIRPLEDEVAQIAGFRCSLLNLGEARFYLFQIS